VTAAARTHDHRTLRSDLRNCTGDGITHAFMVGLGETNFPLFALALGKGDAIVGLVATVPQLVGAMLQLCAPWGIAKMGSPRRWIMVCATIQFLSFGPMVAAALAGAMQTWLLFAVASMYWAVNLGAAPAWNTWVGALFPRRIRVRYFGWRSRVYQLSIMGSLLVGGIALMLGDPDRLERTFGVRVETGVSLMSAFAIVFATAGLCRLWSVWFLKHQCEARALDVNSHRRIGLLEFARKIRGGPDGRLLGAVVAMNIAVQVAQPYCTPYMSRQLGFGDAAVLGTIAASFGAKSLAAPFWGRIAQRHGARCLFVWGALAVVPISALWMASGSYWYILALQALTGAAFGAYELGFFFLALESIKEDERTSMMGLFMLFNSFAAAAGALAGSIAIGAMGAAAGAYMAIFAASTVARAGAYFACRSVREDVLHAVPLATQTLALRPSAGSIDLPEPASIEEPEAMGSGR
jgi:MFS family permease